MLTATPSWGLAAALALSLGVLACDDTVSGAKPIGGDVPTDASLQRFVRRSTLDLTGTPPSDADLAARADELRAAGNTALARRAQVDALMSSDAFATLWTEELENRVLGGNTLEYQYTFLCSILRQQDQACRSCTDADPCTCTCPAIAPLAPERAQLRMTAHDFAAHTASSVLERRYASAEAYTAFLGDAETITTRLFEDFLGRPAEAEELEAGRAMIIGGFGGPAGLLFHRHGATYADLVDIALGSDVYREAIVTRVFNRYLGRTPTSAELSYFAGQLDATAPDVRPVIAAVLTSKEYFEP
ncbi:MAG TPA: DUF1549 domain-containing protein [Kofleriaceae bacterium]|nr:DUF1549 domain-containing protein [Kofleriaceae bacterium]